MAYDQDQHIGRSFSRRVKVIKVVDTEKIQRITVSGLDGEEFELPLRGQPFGLTGVPPVGSVGYLYSANGRPDQGFLSDMEHPDHRPRNREDGETVVYGKAGQKIVLDKNGNVITTPGAGGIVHINPPSV